MIHDEVLGKSSDLSKLLRDTTESAKNLRSKVTWGQTQRSPGVKRSKVRGQTRDSEVRGHIRGQTRKGSKPRGFIKLGTSGHIRLGWSRDKMYKNQKKSKVITALGHAGSFRSRGILITI